MLKIGLTGGIGSGKSTVSKYIRSKGYIVLDADEIAKELTKKGGEVIPFVIENFGADMVDEDGNLNRKKLADLVYNDEEKLIEYEKVTTFKVIDKIMEEMHMYDNCDTLVFADVPLLFEKGMHEMMDYSWLVVTDDDVRIKRVLERDEISEKLVKDIIKNQMTQEEKKKYADVILDNNGTLEFLYEQIDILLEKYQQKV